MGYFSLISNLLGSKALGKYIPYSIIAILIAVIWYKSNSYNHCKVDMDNKVLSLEKELVVFTANYTSCRSAVRMQNREIEELHTKVKDATEKYSEWKNKKPSIKYKTVYKTIYKDVNNTRKETCESIKTVLDNVKHINYDSL